MQGNPDPFVSLGARSPVLPPRGACASRPGCRIAGSIAHTYPVSNYGLDVQIETRVDKVEDNLFAAIQSVGALVWLGLVYALKGVLLLLEWAFSLDLLNEAMGSVRSTLDQLHRRVLGTPWFLAAIAIAGLWGIWRGLVQRRTIQTAAGLAATVALMLCALVVIRDPAGTVGHASRLANDASLGFMSAASTGSVERPAGLLRPLHAAPVRRAGAAALVRARSSATCAGAPPGARRAFATRTSGSPFPPTATSARPSTS